MTGAAPARIRAFPRAYRTRPSAAAPALPSAVTSLLTEGDAHVIRNAGGVITEDAIRSLAISQRLLGTRGLMLIHHTDCGMLTVTDDDFTAQIETDTGLRPP